PKMMSPGAAISGTSMSMYSHLIDVLPAPDAPLVVLQSQAVVAVYRKRHTAEVDRFALQGLIRQVHELFKRGGRTVCGRVPAVHVQDVDLGIALINRVGKRDDQIRILRAVRCTLRPDARMHGEEEVSHLFDDLKRSIHRLSPRLR